MCNNQKNQMNDFVIHMLCLKKKIKFTNIMSLSFIHIIIDVGKFG